MVDPPAAEGLIDLGAIGRSGWTTCTLLDPEAVGLAQQIVDGVDLDAGHGFYASPAMSWGPLATEVDRRLKELVVPRLRGRLPGYRPLLAGITSKGESSDTVIELHQDWTYVDERRWQTVFLWCPLVDVDEDNGALAVVPGSHRWSRDIRPSRSREAAHGLQDVLWPRATVVPLRAGQALAFDPAVLHGSGANRTAARRPAFTIAFVPEEAELLHFHLDDEGRLEGFKVDEAFFTENPYRARPVGSYAPAEPFAPVLTEATLRRSLGAAAGGDQAADDLAGATTGE